jgi:hypothetical protein
VLSPPFGVRSISSVTQCPECSFVYEDIPTEEVSGRIKDLGWRYREALTGVDPELAARRPDPQTWSAAEYACHVRDVLLIQRERVVLARVETKPGFARMYRDERVPICRYGSDPLEVVLDQLAMAAEMCATVFRDLDEAAWSRLMIYNFPNPTDRDVAWLGRHTIHEGEHHLADVHKVLGESQ